MPAPASHDERLWPGPLGWALAPALGLAVLIALFPAVPDVAWVGGVLATVAGLAAVRAVSPRVRVADGDLEAGGARIPVTLLGATEVLDRAGVHRAVGPGSDARVFAVLRAGLPGGVLVAVTDPQDPTPAWLVSSRRPAELAAAIAAERQAAHSRQIG